MAFILNSKRIKLLKIHQNITNEKKGMGTKENVEAQMGVGIGTLCGCTVFVITIPWFLSIYVGRVNIEGGVPRTQIPKLIPEGNKDIVFWLLNSEA